MGIDWASDTLSKASNHRQPRSNGHDPSRRSDSTSLGAGTLPSSHCGKLAAMTRRPATRIIHIHLGHYQIGQAMHLKVKESSEQGLGPHVW
jgi:hypothetical protein